MKFSWCIKSVFHPLHLTRELMSTAFFAPRQMVRGGLKALESFMRAEKARYNHAPVVLITGQPFVTKPSDRQPYNDQIEATGKQLELVLRHKLRLHTVTAEAGYNFPTVSECHEAFALTNRVGASTIVATGTGVAVDLAKAVAASNKKVEQLILCPGTLGGALASSTMHPLLLDPVEETLVYQQQEENAGSADLQKRKDVGTVIALLSNNIEMDKPYKQNSILAALTIALDYIYRDAGGDTESMEIILEKAQLLLANVDSADFVEIFELCYLAGELVSFGVAGNGETRSLSLALASSLLTTAECSQFNTMTLWASLAPTLRKAVLIRHPERDLIGIPQAPTVVTNESVDELLSHIHANQALWSCCDCSDDEFREILGKHVLVDQ